MMRQSKPMLMTRILILSFFLSGCAAEFAAVSGGLNTAYSAYREYIEKEEPLEEKEEVQRRLEKKLSEGKRQEGVLLEGSEVPR
jgi:hypothetical protein